MTSIDPYSEWDIGKAFSYFSSASKWFKSYGVSW